MKKVERVRLSINIEKDVKEKFLTLAKFNGTDSNKLIRRYIKKYISKHKKELENEEK